VGGSVEAASIVDQVMPQYPAIAKTAHVSGTIVLHATIAKDGTVQELTYISGPPLLIKAAIDAVRTWRYRPTMLNGEPVEVETTIDVVFNFFFWGGGGGGETADKNRRSPGSERPQLSKDGRAKREEGGGDRTRPPNY
jgi:TonB family protein